MWWLLQEGFPYYHAKATHLIFVYWIRDTRHTQPTNASQCVGIWCPCSEQQ